MKTRNSSVYLLVAVVVLAVAMGFYAVAGQTNLGDLLKGPQPAPGKRLAYGKEPDQFGDLYLPEGHGPFPVVILVHGGCWSAELPGSSALVYTADDLRKSGIAVWNLEYRRLDTEGGGYPGTFRDIADGVDYLRKINDTYNLDISNVVAIGHSAGGHLVMWAAARSRIKSSSPLYSPEPLPIKAVISLSGVNDLKWFYEHDKTVCGGPGIVTRLINAAGRHGVDPYADTSPAAMLPFNVDQVEVVGDLDTIVPDKLAIAYAAEAKAVGDKVKLIEVAGANHMDLVNPMSGAWKQVKQELLNYVHPAAASATVPVVPPPSAGR